MKYDESEYILYDPFEGDKDQNIRLRQVRMVTTRKEHQCVGNDNKHTIPTGTKVRFEKALVDGEWWSWRMCIHCIDAWLESEMITPKEA